MSEVGRRKYLARYAEPEAGFAQELRHQYAAALVVPLHAEDDGFLERLKPATVASRGRVLVVAVVNASDASAQAAHDQNARLLRSLTARLVPRQELSPVSGSPATAILGRPGPYDLLVIDRASPGQRLPDREGVGLARRIGMDVAVALHEAGGIVSPWLGSTDADATLPADYFGTLAGMSQQPLAADGTRRVALTLPFEHVPGDDPAVDLATQKYELSLRYYTLGLAAAGSPYAYESLGSALSVLADAYCEVRGFPKRQAGEDFYLLDKLAKVGSIHRPQSSPIALSSRVSQRVPFGTGPRVREILERPDAFSTYHPRVFELLRLVQAALRQAVLSQSEERVVAELSRELDVGSVGAISTALDELQAFEALREMFDASSDARVRLRRLLTWFDALRTLRFIHLVESPAGLPRLPLLEALAKAPFLPLLTSRPAARADAASINAWKTRLQQAERALALDIGVENAIAAPVNPS